MSSNPYLDSALNAGGYAAVADQTSDIARNTNAANLLQSDGNIEQTERLFTVRPRYASTSTLAGQNGSDQAGNRGQWAYIKLMTSQTQYSEYVSGSTSRALTYTDLVGSKSAVSEMADPSGSQTYGYDKFLITSVGSQFTEKTQIVEVFGDNEVVYYFGREPLIFSIGGVLVDSPDNNWFVNWLKMYSDFLRGTQLAKNYELLKLVLPNMALTGTITGFSFQQSSERDTDIAFTFQFLAKVVEPLPAQGGSMIMSNNLSYVNFSQANSFTGQSAINSLKSQANSLSAVLSNPSSSLLDKATALSNLGSNTGGSFGQYLQDSKQSINGFQSTVEGWNTSKSSYFDSIKSSAMYQTVTSSLLGIRLNLFSPIYGVMSSLTKLVVNTTNQALSLFNSVVSPVRGILRDITNISRQAISLVNLVNASIRGVGRTVNSQLKGVSTDFQTAIATLGKAAGAIATAPLTVSQSVGNMFTNSQLPAGVPFMQTNSKLTFTRPVLPSGSAPPISKARLLLGISRYNVTSSAKL